MADSRRRTLANTQAGSGIPVPSSAARPSARQSLAASHSTNAARQSLAPARLGASRQSMAPALSQEAGGSQGSQMFSQGHGGPPREAPATVGRSSMYTSLGAMSASRNAGVLRSGGAQTEYAPPRFVPSRPRPVADVCSVNDGPRRTAARWAALLRRPPLAVTRRTSSRVQSRI